MPITPASVPASSSIPQNATPAAISRSSSAADMYGSCQRSSGITPRYASAAALTIASTSSSSSSRIGRSAVIDPENDESPVSGAF